ncbi:hypothetical protein NKH18_09155 [Streptomyces sp. M10(2022)]
MEARRDGRRHLPPRGPGPGRALCRACSLLSVAVLLVGASACGGRATTHHKPGTSHEQAEGDVGQLLATDDGTGHRLRQVDAAGAPA